MPATACPSRRFPGMDRAIPGPLRAKGPRPLGTRVTGMTGMTARRTHAFGRHRVPPDRPFGRCVPAGMRGRPRRVPRRSRCGSLATLPRVAFRTPPLTPAPDGERLHSMAPRGRHHSAVVTGRGLSPGSPRAGRCSPRSRPPARGSAGAHLDATSSDGADMRLPVDARCVSVRTRRLSAAAHTRISCPAGRVPRACGTLVASRSRETGRGAAAPLRDVRAARPIRITSRFPGRRPSPAPSCGRSPCRSRARAVCRPS